MDKETAWRVIPQGQKFAPQAVSLLPEIPIAQAPNNAQLQTDSHLIATT